MQNFVSEKHGLKIQWEIEMNSNYFAAPHKKIIVRRNLTDKQWNCEGFT